MASPISALEPWRRLEGGDLSARAHPVEIAESLDHLEPAAAGRALAALPFDLAVAVLDQPEFGRRVQLFQTLAPEPAGRLLRAMSPDQRARLFRELPPAERDRLLPGLDPAARITLQQLLDYPRETAGAIMTTDYAGVPPEWTAGEAIDHIRAIGRSRRPVYAIYVTTPEWRLLRVLSLRELVCAAPETPVCDVGQHRRLITVTPTTDREEVARLLAQYNLLAVPVIDDGQRLIGTVTVDDVIDALVREQTEDIHRLGGLEAFDTPYTKISFPTMIRKRAGWLCVLFVSEMATASAMQHFQFELSQALVLSLFIPLVISSGGNSGSQATCLIIRALGLREVQLRDWWRVAARELPAGIVLGVILGVLGAARIAAWQVLGLYNYGAHWMLVGATVAAALVGVVTFGSLAGSMLPFALRRLGFDPASASAPFVATLVDVTGLTIYFGVAYLILRGTLL